MKEEEEDEEGCGGDGGGGGVLWRGRSEGCDGSTAAAGMNADGGGHERRR